MASTNYLDFGYLYGSSHHTGHSQHKIMSHGSSHGRFHPYMRSNVHNKSLYEDVSNPTLSTQYEPMYQQQYSNYFISPMNSYPNMTGDRLSTTTGSHFVQKMMYEDLLGLYSRGMEPIHSQMAPLQTLQDVCETNVVPGTKQLCAGQTIDKSRNHPFYWRKRSEPAAGMTRTRDKYRVVYTEKQRIGLEKSYDENKFITKTVKAQLSKELDLSERQIKIWFQNRRAKERRDSRKSKDTDTSDDDISNKDDNDTNINTFENSPNNSQFPASCRFNENNSITENIGGYSTGQCRFMKHGASTSGGMMSRDTTQTQRTSVTDYPDVFQSRHSISPTEWSTTINNTLSTLNVSPLAINMDFGLIQRM